MNVKLIAACVSSLVFSSLISVTSAQSNNEPEEFLNYGSVLFSFHDIDKPYWTVEDLTKLYCRWYFQQMLPPRSIVEVADEYYVTSHLCFIKKAYDTLKQKAGDAFYNKVISSSLSDTLGGYLKSKVIPITKYAYYSGSASYKPVSELFDFYKNLMCYLRTNGESWQPPNEEVLSRVPVNLHARKVDIPEIVKQYENPCEELAYFERSRLGMTAPVPSVRWDQNASVIFLPFKNRTLFPLNSPESADNIMLYYILATSCLSKNGNALNDFKGKFQTWVVRDVVPHLKQDDLYPGFGGVLNIVQLDTNLNKVEESLFGSFFHLKSRNYIIIGVLLAIELFWCCPALCYVCYMKKRTLPKIPPDAEASPSSIGTNPKLVSINLSAHLPNSTKKCCRKNCKAKALDAKLYPPDRRRYAQQPTRESSNPSKKVNVIYQDSTKCLLDSDSNNTYGRGSDRRSSRTSNEERMMRKKYRRNGRMMNSMSTPPIQEMNETPRSRYAFGSSVCPERHRILCDLIKDPATYVQSTIVKSHDASKNLNLDIPSHKVSRAPVLSPRRSSQTMKSSTKMTSETTSTNLSRTSTKIIRPSTTSEDRDTIIYFESDLPVLEMASRNSSPKTRRSIRPEGREQAERQYINSTNDERKRYHEISSLDHNDITTRYKSNVLSTEQVQERKTKTIPVQVKHLQDLNIENRDREPSRVHQGRTPTDHRTPDTRSTSIMPQNVTTIGYFKSKQNTITDIIPKFDTSDQRKPDSQTSHVTKRVYETSPRLEIQIEIDTSGGTCTKTTRIPRLCTNLKSVPASPEAKCVTQSKMISPKRKSLIPVPIRTKDDMDIHKNVGTSSQDKLNRTL